MNRIIKKIIRDYVLKYGLIVTFPVMGHIKSKKASMDSEAARELLNEIHPKRAVECFTDDRIIQADYDLHIIIPAYNAASYIEACLLSVTTNKSPYKLYVTVVNDGSRDDTGLVLNRYEKYDWIEVISQENRGLSEARNTGLSVIRGRYLMFLDADDFLPQDSIERLISTADTYKSDVVEGSYYKFNEKGVHTHMTHDMIESVDHINNRLWGFACGKVYKAGVFEEILFPKSYLFEDSIISLNLYGMPYKCTTIKEDTYAYRDNVEGITKSVGVQPKVLDSYWVSECVIEEMYKVGRETTELGYEYFLLQVKVNFGRLKHLEDKALEAVFVLTRQLRLKYYSGFNTKNHSCYKQLEKALDDNDYGTYKWLLTYWRFD